MAAAVACFTLCLDANDPWTGVVITRGRADMHNRGIGVDPVIQRGITGGAVIVQDGVTPDVDVVLAISRAPPCRP